MSSLITGGGTPKVALAVTIDPALHDRDPAVAAAYAEFTVQADALAAAGDALDEVDDLEAADRVAVAAAARAGRPAPRVNGADYYDTLRRDREAAVRRQAAAAKAAGDAYDRALANSEPIRLALLDALDAAKADAEAKTAAAHAASATMRRLGTTVRALAHTSAFLSTDNSANGHRRGLDVGLVYDKAHERDPEHRHAADYEAMWRKVSESVRAFPVAAYREPVNVVAAAERDRRATLIRLLGATRDGRGVIRHLDALLRGERVVLLEAERRAWLQAKAAAQ